MRKTSRTAQLVLWLAVFGQVFSQVRGIPTGNVSYLIIACIVKTRERFMGIGQVLTMPLFFASNAIYPLSLMPEWLRAVARVNPLTYLVDALRMLMIEGGQGAHSLLLNFTVLGAVFIVFVVVAARLYPTLIE
jgi:ABC-2 type transport system permease protein